MGFILDFFAHELKKTYEDPEQRQKRFEDRLKTAQDTQGETRVYADVSAGRPKYRFSHLRMNPFYEQRNKMYPHRRYVRREGNE